MELEGAPVGDEELDYVIADATFKANMEDMTEGERIPYLKEQLLKTLRDDPEEQGVSARTRALEVLLKERGFSLSTRVGKLFSPGGPAVAPTV